VQYRWRRPLTRTRAALVTHFDTRNNQLFVDEYLEANRSFTLRIPRMK
jgi:hypothetical protein